MGNAADGDMAAASASAWRAAKPSSTPAKFCGATGFIGSRLVDALASAGHAVIVLARDPAKAAALRPPFHLVTSLDQIASDTRIDAVINFAGEPIVDWLWTRAKRRKILSSRLRMTRNVVRLIARLDRRPAVLVSGSAIGWYGLWEDEELTEFDGGKRCFTHRVCDTWERAAERAERHGVRVVRLRCCRTKAEGSGFKFRYETLAGALAATSGGKQSGSSLQADEVGVPRSPHGAKRNPGCRIPLRSMRATR